MRGWEVLSERPLGVYKLLSLKERTMKNSVSGEVVPFVVVHLANWVNVVAITPNKKFVMVEQSRPGIDDVTLEIPGGTIDKGEEPVAAAARELFEETGYRAAELIQLGRVAVNPALQDNWCYFFLAPNAVRVGDPHPDPAEDITVRLMDIEEVERAVDDGRIVHSLGMLGILKALRALHLTEK